MEIVDKVLKLLDKDANKHLVFYFDEQVADGSFREELDAIAGAGIQVVEVEQNYFSLKYKLEIEWQKQPVFVYHPFAKPANEQLKKYPLLDLLLANHELRLDSASEFISEYGLQEHQLPLVKRYIKQLKVKSNQKKLARILDKAQFNDENLKWGLISIALDFNTVADRNLCLAKWLSLALDDKVFERANKTIISLDLESTLLNWINGLLDTKGKALNLEFASDCACRIKYNMLTVFIDRVHEQDSYAKLKITRVATLNRMQAFFSEWINHPTLGKSIEPVFEQLAKDIWSSAILRLYGANQEYGYYSASMINNVISDLYKQADTNPLKAREECQKWLKKSSLSESNKSQIGFIFHASHLLALLKSYTSFRFNKLEDYIREYTGELYNVDLHFRKAVLNYERVSERLEDFDRVAGDLFAKLNQQYDNFLKNLNVEWQKLLTEKKFSYKDIPVQKQYDFFKNNLRDFEYKIVVIISDAFRYELGQELYNDLVADSKNNVTIEPYLASVPSETSLGMTNLLPHDNIEVLKSEPTISYRINDIPTTASRRKEILQMAEKNSDTISFTNAIKLSVDDGRKFFSDNRIVYVYHDWIDAVGDKKRTEHETFNATSKALEDIKRLIKKLNGWNVYHILVTADHGFLFNHTPLTEANREDMPKATAYQQQHTRFMIADDFEGKVDGYLMEMKNTTSIDTDLKIAIPRALNRYRKQGNVGLQFTHGGASIQELLIPVIKLYRQKKELGQSVSFKRIDENKKISSGSIKIALLQDQPVSNDFKSLEIIIGLYSDTGELFSKEVTIHLNSTSGSPKDRIYEQILSLNPKGSKAGFCYLKAFDKNDKNRLNPIGLNDLLQISSLMEKDF